MSFEELEAQLRQGEANMLAVGIAPAIAMAGPVGGVVGKDSSSGPPAAGFEDDGDSIGADAGADGGDGEANAEADPEVEAESSSPIQDAPASPPERFYEEGEPATRTPNRRTRRRQCQNVCDIAQTMCGLQNRICQLASQHPDKPRYRQVCSQAQGDCSNAQEACHACQ
ncbi:MAG: hypothetical protein ACPG4T_06950 [Nannocystaceae bacterium]